MRYGNRIAEHEQLPNEVSKLVAAHVAMQKIYWLYGVLCKNIVFPGIDPPLTPPKTSRSKVQI